MALQEFQCMFMGPLAVSELDLLCRPGQWSAAGAGIATRMR